MSIFSTNSKDQAKGAVDYHDDRPEGSQFCEHEGHLRGRHIEFAVRRPGLAIIDAQRIFLDPISPARLHGSDHVMANVLLLAATFRAMDLPVVFTRHIERPDRPRGTIPEFFPRPLTPDDPLSEMMPGLSGHMKDGQPLEKCRHDAFCDGIPDVLAGVDVLFVAGVQTNLCILSTALGLARHSIVPVVVSDACAARERADHCAAIRCLGSGHAFIRTTDETLRFLISGFKGSDEA